MNMYSAKATSSIRLRVDYKCCYCQHENSDGDQFLVAAAQSHGSMFPSAKLSSEASQKVSEKMEGMILDMSHGRLESAHLNCACSACGRRQPWASFMKYPVWAVVLFVLGVIAGLTALKNWGQFDLSPRQLLIPAMLLPLVVIFVRNLLARTKLSRLDPQYLPKISLYTDPQKAKKI